MHMPARIGFSLESRSCRDEKPVDEFVDFYARHLFEELCAQSNPTLDLDALRMEIREVEQRMVRASVVHLAWAGPQLVGSLRCTPSAGDYRDLPIEDAYGWELSRRLLRVKQAGKTMELARFALARDFRTRTDLVVSLLKAATDTALANDIDFIVLDTAVGHVNLYRRLGFDPIDAAGSSGLASMRLWGTEYSMMILNFSSQVTRYARIRRDHGLGALADRNLLQRWQACAARRYRSLVASPPDIDLMALLEPTKPLRGSVE